MATSAYTASVSEFPPPARTLPCRFAIDCSPVAGRRRMNALRKALADYFAVRLNRYGPCESKMLLINRHRDYP
jgi:hypothetical protein